MSDTPSWHGTTILSVRKAGTLVMAGDGQVSMGNTIVKPNARKVRRIGDGSIIAGFARPKVRATWLRLSGCTPQMAAAFSGV